MSSYASAPLALVDLNSNGGCLSSYTAPTRLLTHLQILKGLAKFLPDKLPVKIADATELEMNGLPVHTTTFFWQPRLNFWRRRP